MRQNGIVFAALVIVILGMLASGKYLSRTRPHGPLKLVGDVRGVLAPDFTLPSLDGSKVKLSDFRGKAVVLNFWATWCPPCKEEMPWLADLQKQYGKDGLVVLGVAMDDSSPASIAKFASEVGVNYPVLLGTDQVSDDYGDVQYLPTTFYLARDGTIMDKVTGLVGRSEIEADAKKVLNTSYKPISTMQTQASAGGGKTVAVKQAAKGSGR
ncbi:MAG TPA: TlpA disulfide reductase family protein [Terriglobales bacterium]|nr:TlpA disulfide reductase family protein [Terriglobales bacterium]